MVQGVIVYRKLNSVMKVSEAGVGKPSPNRAFVLFCLQNRTLVVDNRLEASRSTHGQSEVVRNHNGGLNRCLLKKARMSCGLE